VECPALTAVWLPEQDFSQYDTYGSYYSYELLDENRNIVGRGSVLFCAPKHFKFVDPQLSAVLDGDEIVVTAKAYARSVEIQAGPDTLLEDNYFDMDAGVRRIKILRGTPTSVLARSVFDIR
jgi:beta-mannosidase